MKVVGKLLGRADGLGEMRHSRLVRIVMVYEGRS